ncbi:MAG: hypothetical protein IKZ10_00730 [Akkermansia sp.]|nr:hypothetical protein [Akkermansia sp.]
MRTFCRHLISALSVTVLLNSCYFNSTARLVDKACYEAQANTADLNTAPNPVVYYDGNHYYVELPRYRYGEPLRIQYSVFDETALDDAVMEKRGDAMFLISESFAEYLTGQGGKEKVSSILQEVPNGDDIKKRSQRIPVVKKAAERTVYYTYRSPNAGWLYAAVPFNWLLVDLPVTVVENGAIAAGVAAFFWLILEADDDECDDCCPHHHHHHHY